MPCFIGFDEMQSVNLINVIVLRGGMVTDQAHAPSVQKYFGKIWKNPKNCFDFLPEIDDTIYIRSH